MIHFAANADVRFGTEHPGRDLQQNTVATFNVLEAMRANGIKRIALSSTGSVYGESAVIPTPEDAPFPIQTSLYAASKVSGEGMISSYCEGFKFEGYIFRFVSILGELLKNAFVEDAEFLHLIVSGVDLALRKIAGAAGSAELQRRVHDLARRRVERDLPGAEQQVADAHRVVVRADGGG